MGIGRATGENRAAEAAKQAIASPLLELAIDGARGILFTITGGKDLGMHEVAEAAKIITSAADEEAKVIFGATIDDALKDEIRITVVATGFDSRERRLSAPGAVEVASQGMWTPSGFAQKPRPSAFSVPVKSAPAAAPAQEEPAEREPRPLPKLPPKPIAPPSMPPKPQAAEEDDMEIPTFIRKKMM
jgi:cell division protein FtsZ